MRQASNKTENDLIDFSDSSWQDFRDNGRSTGAYIIFYQGWPPGLIVAMTLFPGMAISFYCFNSSGIVLTNH